MKVVVATDRSETAQRAVAWAAQLAQSFGGELVLLNVRPGDEDGAEDLLRADAQAFIMQVDTRQKQILIEQRAFAQAIGATNVASTSWTCSSSTTVPGTCSNAFYSISFNPAVDNTAAPPSYTLCATPTGSQAIDGTLTLTSTGAKLRRTGTSCTSGSDLGW